MGTSAFRLGASQTSTTKLVETINQAAHGFAVGDVIRPNPGVTGAFVKAQADSSANAEAIGVISDAGSLNSFTVVYQGECVTDGLSEFNPADVLFLSPDIAGKLTTSPATLPGQVIKPIVVMNDVNEGLVVNYVGSVIGGESSVEVSNLQPVGAVIPWAGATGSEPVGWLVCDGATYYGGYTGAGTTYSNLYGVIGTSFGGSGSTGANDYFHVPNMMGRVPVGAGSGSGLTQRVLGVTGGAESSDAAITSGGTIDTSAADSGDNDEMVSVMQPFTVTNYLIRYEQNSRASISGLLLNDLADAGTTGATAGDILQYEGSGTTGVYESVSTPNVNLGRLQLYDGGELSITAGSIYGNTAAAFEITVTGSHHSVDTPTGDPVDGGCTLSSIIGGKNGQILVLNCAASSGRDIKMLDGGNLTGNLRLAGDFTLTNLRDRIVLINDQYSTPALYNTGGFNHGVWCELSRSNNN